MKLLFKKIIVMVYELFFSIENAFVQITYDQHKSVHCENEFS